MDCCRIPAACGSPAGSTARPAPCDFPGSCAGVGPGKCCRSASSRRSRRSATAHAAGCGSNMKEYELQLRNDVQRREAGLAFSRTVKDASEFLVELGLQPPTRRITLRVAYQDPCHLVHGQKVHQQPRQALKMIPGLELVE